MKFWAGLYAEVDKKALEEGASLMLKLAVDILATKKPKMETKGEEAQDYQDGDQFKG